MRNRWGIEIKKGYHAWFTYGNRRAPLDGQIIRVDSRSTFAEAYGPQVSIRTAKGDEYTVSADDVSQVLPPMRVLKGGVVKANPDSIHIDIGSHNTSGRNVRAKNPQSNPLTRVKLKSPAQRSGDDPSPRLIKRRKATQKAPAGVYANPLESRAVRNRKATADASAPDTVASWNDHFIVQAKWGTSRTFDSIGVFKSKEEAFSFARAHHRQHPERTIRVVSPD